MSDARRTIRPTARVNGGPSTRKLSSEDDKQEQQNKWERRRRLAKRIIDEEEAASPGDKKMFTRIDWDDIDAEPEVPLGLDGILPEHGIVQMYGPAGHGKTILAYYINLIRSRSGWRTGIYECEMGAARAKGLMANLGAKRADLRKIGYYQSANGPSDIVNLAVHGRALDELLQDDETDMLTLDASNALMTAARLSENDAEDFRRFMLATLQPVSYRGGLGILLDHKTKDGGAQRGTSDKPAAGDFSISVKSLRRFSRGVSGTILLTCDKDRNGAVAAGSTMLIKVECGPDGSIRLKPAKWVARGEHDISEQVKDGVSVASTQAKIKKLLDANGEMIVSEIAEELNISESSARNALNRGKDNGKFIKNEDNGKWDNA